MKLFTAARIGVAAIIAFAIFGLSCSFFYTDVEVARVSSPDGAVDATVNETNSGATSPFSYYVSLAPAGKRRGAIKVASLYGAIRSREAWGVNVVWLNAEALEVQYFEARQASLLRATAQVNGRTVHVSLKPGIEDLQAPHGGMEYSSERDRKP